MNNLLEKLPENLINKIKAQYGEDLSEEIFSGYLVKRNVSLRVNPLKSSRGFTLRSE